MEDLFKNIERLAIMNSALKSQNENLRDIVVQLQEVKANPRMQLNIDRAFREYDDQVQKMLDDFRMKRE